MTLKEGSLLGHGWPEIKTAQLACVSIGIVTIVTSAFRYKGKTSVNRVGNCGRQHTFDERGVHALG